MKFWAGRQLKKFQQRERERAYLESECGLSLRVLGKWKTEEGEWWREKVEAANRRWPRRPEYSSGIILIIEDIPAIFNSRSLELSSYFSTDGSDLIFVDKLRFRCLLGCDYYYFSLPISRPLITVIFQCLSEIIF